jgi:hypothetical protein
VNVSNGSQIHHDSQYQPAKNVTIDLRKISPDNVKDNLPHKNKNKIILQKLCANHKLELALLSLCSFVSGLMPNIADAPTTLKMTLFLTNVVISQIISLLCLLKFVACLAVKSFRFFCEHLTLG